ncbi:bifunctional DNA primase/polymerase [Streptomyces pristinaespiralis]|uniref:bifunctional DNA primase/polymerase n=1 Tax=Streptomyces pristinaespiralis TaxID=38300 RepID=UPI0038384B3B
MSKWQQALDAALNAIDSGYAVFPLSINKTPAIKSPHQTGHGCRAQCGQPGHGVHDATTDPAYARQLFELARRATGYGIACGGKLIGLDLDRKNGVDGVASLRALAAKHDFTVPRTMTVCTPSGGLHLWLAGHDGTAVSNSAGRLGPGIDVRGTAGYLVGPGSHGKTGAYTVHPKVGEIAVQPVPAQLLKLMQPPAHARPKKPGRGYVHHTDHTTAALNGLVQVVLGSPEGTRNDRLFWAATKVWAHVADGHMDAFTATGALIDAAVARGLTEAEATRTVGSARRATAGAAT